MLELTLRQKQLKAAEDKAYFTSAVDFGFRKMLSKPDWSKELAIVNSVKEVFGLERAINCQRCVVAHEARMRGYDVIARPSWGFSDPMRIAEQWLRAFDYSNTDFRKCRGESIEEIINSTNKIMQSFGEGSRAVIIFEWNNKCLGEGHVIVSACFVNGVIKFGDPQDGSQTAIHKLRFANISRVYILRIDNLNFTDIVKRCCMNRGELL